MERMTQRNLWDFFIMYSVRPICAICARIAVYLTEKWTPLETDIICPWHHTWGVVLLPCDFALTRTLMCSQEKLLWHLKCAPSFPNCDCGITGSVSVKRELIGCGSLPFEHLDNLFLQVQLQIRCVSAVLALLATRHLILKYAKTQWICAVACTLIYMHKVLKLYWYPF